MTLTKQREGYRFIDKDPIIDLIRTAYLDSPLTGKEIAIRARISPTTLDNMLFGKTRRPQNRTCQAIFDVLGIETRHVYRATGSELVVEREVYRKFVTRKTARSNKSARKVTQLKLVREA